MFGRTRAPELTGRGWINTGGKELTLEDLKGKIVLLDFWTFCCINCLHVLDELRPLEEKYEDVLVTIGVHSPKFEHEKDPVALADAVERYEVSHPVLDDPEMATWRQYAARAWPTLCLIDPEGYIVATVSGEGHGSSFDAVIQQLIEKHEEKGTLRRGDSPYVAPEPADTALRFPGKAIISPSGGFLVSSSAHHQIVELSADGETVLRRIGSGERGRSDGNAQQAQFSEPAGMCLLPDDIAQQVGYELVVADTVNHLLRGVKLSDGSVVTLAGTGKQLAVPIEHGENPALGVDMSSPWDVAWFDSKVIVAMAGIHQLWWFDPIQGTTGVYAGTAAETLLDGYLLESCLAQPSGLSVADELLWIADSETSALRWTDGKLVQTLVGHGLFDFGLMDGPAENALFQHPLGVCVLEDRSVLIADTYNGAVRRYDPSNDTVTTVTTGLAEPSDVVVNNNGDVFVVESAAHRLVRLAPGALEAAGVHGKGTKLKVERPETVVSAGGLELNIVFNVPEGQKLDDSFGPPVTLEVIASPPELLIQGAGASNELTRSLVISDKFEKGVLSVDIRAATCDANAEHAACHLSAQSWGIPIRISPDGPKELSLIFRGIS